jgi:excisionase family DNA binding protein
MSAGSEGSAVEARFMLLSDVAAELNVSDSQVYHMVRSGELPAIKIGGRGQWRVERARLEEYIQQKYSETATWVHENPLNEREPD